MPDLRQQYANIENTIENMKYKAKKYRSDAEKLIINAEILEICADDFSMALEEEKKKKIMYRCVKCGDLIVIDIENFHCLECIK